MPNIYKELRAPLIKWSGSKRKQAPYIVSLFPRRISTYYECFLGGGSVLHEVMNRVLDGTMRVNRLVGSDLNSDLIGIWSLFKKDRNRLFDYYVSEHEELKRRGEPDITPDTREQCNKCQHFYYEERERFNRMPKTDPERPMLFFWLMRTSFNGLVRYNGRGEFNSPFHVGGRFGITPDMLRPVFDEWARCIGSLNVTFVNDSYDNVIAAARQGDLVYMDPPYANVGPMYFAEGFDQDHMFDVMRSLTAKGVKFALSYDGKTGDKDTTVAIPRDTYLTHEYVYSGQSSFRKLDRIDVTEVHESLYLNYTPEKRPQQTKLI